MVMPAADQPASCTHTRKSAVFTAMHSKLRPHYPKLPADSGKEKDSGKDDDR